MANRSNRNPGEPAKGSSAKDRTGPERADLNGTRVFNDNYGFRLASIRVAG